MIVNDILLFQTNDGGDIIIENGRVKTTAGLETAVYLSLFGGNDNDSGIGNNLSQWWGNINEPVLDRYRSQTQFTLKSIPLISGNLARIRDAVSNDLSWLVETEIASSLMVELFIEDVNKLRIEIEIEVKSIEFSDTNAFINELDLMRGRRKRIILIWRPVT